MSAAIPYGGDKPLFYLGDFPVRLITLLVAMHSAAMVLATLLSASGHKDWLDLLIYNSAEVAHGQIWRLFTYAFVATPSIWFLVEMVMLYSFGKEVENGLGWQRFGILYAGLILLGPLLLQAFGYAGIPQIAAGAQEVDFAIFAAFVTMHPGAQFFFGIAARWVLIALIAISSLQLLAAQDPPRLLVLLSSSALAIMLMRRAGFEEPLFGWGFEWSLPTFGKTKSPKTKPPKTNAPFSVVQGGISSSSPARSSQPSSQKPFIDPEVEMDRLLEKISSKGINSLSTKERTALEEARQAILQRSGKN